MAALLANLGIAVAKFVAFVVAIVLFTLGGVFSMVEGYEKLRHPEELGSA